LDAAPPAGTYRFAGFVLDIRRGALLTAAGEELSLRRQSFELLRLLVENAGRLLDRGTINRVIWPDVTVSDDSITQCVRDIRRAIGDDAQRILKTVPRRGYLLAADVVMACDPPVAPLPQGLALPDKPSLVVLPFQNMSSDPEQIYFVDGLVEDITTALSCIRSLFVIARNSAFAYQGRGLDVRQIGRDLGVRYALEGSVRRAGNRLRVTTQLIDATSGGHIWAGRYDRDVSDIFAVQDEIATSVAGIIEPALADAEQQRVLRKPTERLDAWEAYQRGLWHFYNHGSDENRAARTFFHRAIELDPKFAPGHYGYALALQWEIWHYSTRPFSEVQGLPLEEALIAVSLDDRDAMGHAVLAHMRMWGSDWDGAIAEARKAVALNPNGSFGIAMLGCVLGFGGYREEALDCLRQAMRASPHDPFTSLWLLWIGLIQFFARQFAAATETLRQVGRLRPYYNNYYTALAAALAYQGRLDEAHDVLSHAPPVDPRYLRAPWLRPEDVALRVEGFRLATGESNDSARASESAASTLPGNSAASARPARSTPATANAQCATPCGSPPDPAAAPASATSPRQSR
jgi:adenylate cyclase